MNCADLLLESDDPREAVEQVIAELRSDGKTEAGLAHTFDVTQSTISRWASGASVPSRRNREKLRRIYLSTKYGRWDSQRFFPICAFATAYPTELQERAVEALDDVLCSSSLTPKAKECQNTFAVDLHIRPAKLPSYVTAYAFVNDLDNPTVFVVLVRDTLSLAEQREKGWDEVYEHVVKYSRERIVGGGSGQQGLRISPSMLRTMRHNNLQAIEGRTDEGQS
jgi:transcriptional regulator with XRE-family HTH domain